MLTLSRKNFFRRYLPIFLSVVILLTSFSIYSIFKSDTKIAEAGWYSSSWTYRKPITIDHTKISQTATTTFSNFPLLINVTDTDLKYTSYGGKVASSTGADILFTASDGTTKLDHEIENYASTTGETIAWVRIPTMHATYGDVVYIYFGNSGASSQQNPTGVWDSNYRWVNHWGNETTLSLEDSTSNNLDAHNNNSAPATAGKISGAVESQSSGGKFIYWDHTDGDFSGNFTASFWVYLNNAASGNGDFIFGQMYGATDLNVLYFSTSDQKIRSQIRKDNTTPSTTGAMSNALSTGAWYHIAYVMDTSDNVSVYVDGSATSATHGANQRMSEALGGTVIRIGSASSWWSQNDAKYDEVRFSHSVRSADWIATEYKNQSSPSTFYSYGTLGVQTRTNAGMKVSSQSSSLGWYSTGGTWTNRKQITINPDQLSTTATSTFSNFPMLFSVTDADLKFTGSGGKVASSTGGDILFTASDGTTKLDHEIEKYTSTTGETIAWVRIPTLSSSTVAYIYFGNASATDQQAATSTWDSNYKGVYHLKDGTTLNYNDSTSNAKHGTGGGGSASPTAGAGYVDGAASFNNVTYQYIDLPSSTFGSGSVTVELWSKFTTFTGYWPMFSAYTSDADSMEIFIDNTNRLFGGNYNNRALSSSDLVTGKWYHVVLTAVSGGVTQFYINGVASGSTGTTNFSTYTVAPRIGRRLSYYYNNLIDEVRVSSGIARSADWIKTTYNNQSNSSLFYSYGALQSQSRVNTSGSTVPAVKIRGGVKFR